MSSLSRGPVILSWLLQLVVAGILFQTLFFKFSGAEESVYIFRTLGMEPWGRIGSGVAELIAVVLLLIPRTVPLGAILSVGVISGAIISHLTKLGIIVKGDGGLLFGLACVVLVGSLAILLIRRTQIPVIGHLFRTPHPAAADGNVKRIVILGGGFGGVYTAIELEKTLARDKDIEVLLVSKDNFFLFTPMLHEVAASDLDVTHIVSPLRKLLPRTKLFMGGVRNVDVEKKTVYLCHGTNDHGHDIPYDQLVVALGCETNFYGLPGVEEHSQTMKTLGDAIRLRSRVIDAMEEADTECAVAMRDHLLSVVVVGGGFAGVETIGAVNDFVRHSLRFYPHLDQSMVRMVLVHSGEVILPELGEELGRYAMKKLSSTGVEIRTKSRVASASDAGVTLTDGTFIPTSTIVWTAGTSPHPLLALLPCGKKGGKIAVDQTMRVIGHDGIWSLGDCAAVPDPRTGKFHPPTAQHALRQGKVLAGNIEAALRGGTLTDFDFRTIGLLATIGRRSGVAKILGFKFSGIVAWFLWRSIYLSKLPRLERKIRVAIDWTLDLFFTKDLVQFLNFREGRRFIESAAEREAKAPREEREGFVEAAVA